MPTRIPVITPVPTLLMGLYIFTRFRTELLPMLKNMNKNKVVKNDEIRINI